MTKNPTTTLDYIREGSQRQARRNAIVADLREGRRQRAARIPSGRVYNRKAGKRAEA